MAKDKSNVVKLLNPSNAKFSGQEKVNAEIFTALEILGRKLERTENERDRLADRLEMLESGATFDEETGKIYLPAVIDDKGKKSLSAGNSTVLTITSTVSAVLAACAFALVLLQNPDFTSERIAQLKSIYTDSGLTPTEQLVMLSEDEKLAELDMVADVKEVKAEVADIEKAADSKQFKKKEAKVEEQFAKILEEQVKPEKITEAKEIKPVKVKVAEEEAPKKEIAKKVLVKNAAPKKEEKLVIKSPVAVVKKQKAPVVKEIAKKEAPVEANKDAVEAVAAAPKEEVKGDTGYVAYDMPADGNLSTDLKKLEQAAFSGVPEAQHDLGVYYAEGQLIAQDYDRAVYWLNKAAMNGVANASYNLAVMYQQGMGVDQNMKEALKYYNYAVELGHAEAMYNMGIIYFTGKGAKKNLAKGVGYFKRAANMGVVEAAYNLGVLYESDVIGEVNVDKAKKWYNLAAGRGYNQAKEALARIEKSVYSKGSISKVEKAKNVDNIANR